MYTDSSSEIADVNRHAYQFYCSYSIFIFYLDMQQQKIANQPQSINAEQNISQDPHQTSEKFLDTVVNTIIKKQTTAKDFTHHNDYPQIFSDIKHVLNDFDISVSQCKKYNEAKIHRKYEIRIKDLEDEVKLLNDKIREEQKARSPSQKYIDELIDKLVHYKEQNERLNGLVAEIQQKYNELVNISGPSETMKGSKIFSDPQKIRQAYSISIISKNENPEHHFDLCDEVKEFLQAKSQEKKNRPDKKSSFESFLIKYQKKIPNWTNQNFLQKIEEWSNELIQRLENKSKQLLRPRALPTYQDETTLSQQTILPPLHMPKSGRQPLIQQSKYYSISGLTRWDKSRQRQQGKKVNSTIQVLSRTPKYKLM